MGLLIENNSYTEEPMISPRATGTKGGISVTGAWWELAPQGQGGRGKGCLEGTTATQIL